MVSMSASKSIYKCDYIHYSTVHLCCLSQSLRSLFWLNFAMSGLGKECSLGSQQAPRPPQVKRGGLFVANGFLAG